MRLVIRLHAIEAPPGYREQVEDRLRAAITRYGPRLGRITVFLADVNGPRGALGLRCRIVAGLRGCGEIVAEGEGADAMDATYLAIERLARTAARAIMAPARRTRPPPAGLPRGGTS